MQRVDHENCTHCGNGTAETLSHKFYACTRVEAAWAVLQQRITAVLGGWRRLAFEKLIKPELVGINKRKRIRILKLLITYICYINECTGSIDVNELNFHFDIET